MRSTPAAGALRSSAPTSWSSTASPRRFSLRGWPLFGARGGHGTPAAGRHRSRPRAAARPGRPGTGRRTGVPSGCSWPASCSRSSSARRVSPATSSSSRRAGTWRLRPAGRGRTFAGDARTALLCVGNWVARKGILQALDAVARLPPGLTRLHLVGDDRPDPRYAARVRRRLARADLAGRVECHGRLGRDQVAAMYRDADVFVLPSVREPYGTVYGEAMAGRAAGRGMAGGQPPPPGQPRAGGPARRAGRRAGLGLRLAQAHRRRGAADPPGRGRPGAGRRPSPPGSRPPSGSSPPSARRQADRAAARYLGLGCAERASGVIMLGAGPRL